MANKIFGFGMGTFAIFLIVAYTQRNKLKSILRRG